MEVGRGNILRMVAGTCVLLCCLGAVSDAGQALFERGLAFDNGGAARPDAAAAFGWYRRAAAAGSAAGAFNVGVMYDAGRGVAHDPAQAAAWYAVAAAGASPRAAYDLGDLYAGGEGVPRNPDLAQAWFTRAAELGVAEARARARGQTPVAHPAASSAPPAARTMQPLLLSAQDGVSLVWVVPPWTDPARFFVQVAALRGGGAETVFSGVTPVSAMRIALAPGAYAWRVLTVDPLAAHYTPSPWSRFSVPAS